MYLNLYIYIYIYICGFRYIIQINHQPIATIFQFIILAFIYSLTCFGRSPAHHQELSDCSGSLWFYLRIMVTVVLCSWSVRSARPRAQHDCYHDTKVKPEAAAAVIELLMLGGRTPETCWAVNKRQDNKLGNCCTWLVIYLNCTMLHGLTNLKFRYINYSMCMCIYIYIYIYVYIYIYSNRTEQERHCRYSVTLSRTRITIVAVENQ